MYGSGIDSLLGDKRLRLLAEKDTAGNLSAAGMAGQKHSGPRK